MGNNALLAAWNFFWLLCKFTVQNKNYLWSQEQAIRKRDFSLCFCVLGHLTNHVGNLCLIMDWTCSFLKISVCKRLSMLDWVKYSRMKFKYESKLLAFEKTVHNREKMCLTSYSENIQRREEGRKRGRKVPTIPQFNSLIIFWLVACVK